jgi:PEGA domain-containing protein
MSSLAMTERPEAPLFSDGLGERVVAADGATGELLQILRVRAELTAVPSVEFALRERAARLANFRHACYARVRRIDRGMGPSPALAVVSDHVEGTRLSDILRVAHERGLYLDINAALSLIRQLVPAVAVLHENARDVAHGLIAPERLLVTPNARLVVVEHVLGAAIEQLQYGRERLWQAFRIGLPLSAGLARFDHRADVTGMGLVALALVLGRPIAGDEYPHRIGTLLGQARERYPLGEERPLSPALHGWLARALQLDTRRAFASGPEAMAALDDVVAGDSAYVAAPVAFETFLSRYVAAVLDPFPQLVEPAPAFVPPAVKAAIDETAPAPPAAHARSSPEPFDLTDLLDVRDLPGVEEAPAQPRTLFDPDRPFTAPEIDPASDKPPAARPWIRYAAIAALLALVGGGYYAIKLLWTPAAPPAMGTLAVQSNPAGVPVFVDGVERGRTPSRVTLAPGAHILELRGTGVPRVIPFTVNAGGEVSQYLEFADSPATGQLAIQSTPPGAKVLVDGTERGVAPITIADLAPGNHEVVLQSDGANARHTVVVLAGATASLVVPMAAAATGPVSGWISLKAPFTIEIHEQGRLLGTTDTESIMLAAGRHELELVNEGLAYRATRVVQVTAGKVATLPLELPKGVVNLNATPWAEVWVDGERVGETPIGNLAIAIGPHEVVFRHPQFGEKRQAVSVTLAAPMRISVDMK